MLERLAGADASADAAPVTTGEGSTGLSGQLAPAKPDWLHEFGARYALIVVWGVMAGVFYMLRPDTFGTIGSFSSIFGSQQVYVFLAMSAMTTLIVGEFDLSVASIMGMSATIVPVLAGLHGMNIVLACAIALGACLLAGAVNAFFVVHLDVSSFVVTLGTGTLMIGLTQKISSGTLVSVNNKGLATLVGERYFDLPLAFYYGLGVALMFTYVLGWTPVGRAMQFVGANREVARLAGISVPRIRVGAYLVASLFSGLAGLVLVGEQGGFDPPSAARFLLPTLAAVFLGTAVVHPGRFNPIGTLIAIYFLQTGIFGLQLLEFKGWIINVFYGGGLVVAVTVAKIVAKRSSHA